MTRILLLKYQNFSRQRKLLTELSKPFQVQKHTGLKIC